MSLSRFVSADQSDDDDEPRVSTSIVEPCEYTLRPNDGKDSFFTATNLKGIYDDFTNTCKDKICIGTVNKLKETHLKLTKKAIVCQHLIQFQYKEAPHLLLTTNAYGLFINDSENFTSRNVIQDLDHLQAKHRVNLLLQTVKYWWNQKSKELMEAFIETFVTNMKCIANTSAFIDAVDCYKLHDFAKVVQNMKAKILTADKISKNDRITPAVFGVRLYNSFGTPSKITAPLYKIKNQQTLTCGKWKELKTAAYMHSVLLLKVAGFKLTSLGITLDMFAETLVFDKFERTDKINKAGSRKVLSRFTTQEDQTSSEEECDEQPEKKRKVNMDDW